MQKKSKGRTVLLAIFCYALGALSGITLQKFYPVGQLLGIDIISYLTAPQPRHARREVSVETVKRLPLKRVMVALAFGQSNSANFGDVLHEAGPGVFNFNNGKLYNAQDPLLGADGRGGSVWPLLGDKLIAAKRYDAVVFASIGVGTTDITQWRPDGEHFPKMQKAIKELQNQGLPPTHLFWHQGETDGRLRTSTRLYKTEFLKMIQAIRQMGVKAPLYVCQASRCMKQPPIASVRLAQKQLADQYPDIFEGPDTDALGFEYRHDGCHLSDAGQKKFADLWMEKLR